jgi:hypothetical protein
LRPNFRLGRLLCGPAHLIGRKPQIVRAHALSKNLFGHTRTHRVKGMQTKGTDNLPLKPHGPWMCPSTRTHTTIED